MVSEVIPIVNHFEDSSDLTFRVVCFNWLIDENVLAISTTRLDPCRKMFSLDVRLDVLCTLSAQSTK
jgi:hypothetical protein